MKYLPSTPRQNLLLFLQFPNEVHRSLAPAVHLDPRPVRDTILVSIDIEHVLVRRYLPKLITIFITCVTVLLICDNDYAIRHLPVTLFPHPVQYLLGEDASPTKWPTHFVDCVDQGYTSTIRH